MAYRRGTTPGIDSDVGWLHPFDLRGRSLRFAVLTLLEQAGRPLSLGEIQAGLLRHDLHVGGATPAATLADALRYEVRLGRVVRVARATYAVGGNRAGSTVRSHRHRLRLLTDAAARLRRQGHGPARATLPVAPTAPGPRPTAGTRVRGTARERADRRPLRVGPARGGPAGPT